jgi:hypothetical protein
VRPDNAAALERYRGAGYRDFGSCHDYYDDHNAAELIGDGLYGVDLKMNGDGVFVIEINDNPDVDRGIEAAGLRGDLYRIILKDLARRIEARSGPRSGRDRPVRVAMATGRAPT